MKITLIKMINKRVYQTQRKAKNKEGGAALVVALVVLLVVTSLVVSSMRSSLRDLYSAQTYSAYNQAFQSAELGLRIAESIIESATSDSEANDLLSAANITVQASNSSDYSSSSFWQGIDFYSTEYQVKIVVEQYQKVFDSMDLSDPGEPIWYYKITARGVDAKHATLINSIGEAAARNESHGMTVVQSIYAKRYAP